MVFPKAGETFWLSLSQKMLPGSRTLTNRVWKMYEFAELHPFRCRISQKRCKFVCFRTLTSARKLLTPGVFHDETFAIIFD
jgi:hypothetical protein